MEIERHLAGIQPSQALDRIEGPPTERVPALLVVVWPLRPDGYLAAVSNQVIHTSFDLAEVTMTSDGIDKQIDIKSTVRGYVMATGRTPADAIASAMAVMPKDG